MKDKILPFSLLLLVFLTSAVFWGTWLSMTRSMEQFSPGEFIHIGKVIIQNVAWPMRIMMIAAILLMIIYLWIHPSKRSRDFYLSVTASLLYLGTFVITVAILVPMDYEIKTWTAENFPSQWEAMRDKWKLFHALRTFLSVTSFASFAYSFLFFHHKSKG